MNRLNDCVALVTGGAQGIGLGIVKTLLAAGSKVAIADLQFENSPEFLQSSIPDNNKCIQIISDISTEDGCRHAVDACINKFGKLDIIVNNAAPGRNRNLLGELTGSDWEIHSQIVLQSVTRLTEHALPYLKDAENAVIVNISSTTARSIASGQCTWPYHVSKAGLEHLTRYLACTLGQYGIRVNAVAPGLVDRDVGYKLSDNPANYHIIKSSVPLSRAGTSKDIGQTVVFLCSDSSAYITGQTLVVDGGLGIKEVFGAVLESTNKNK